MDTSNCFSMIVCTMVYTNPELGDCCLEKNLWVFLAVDSPIGPSQHPHCHLIWRYPSSWSCIEGGNSRNNNFCRCISLKFLPRLRKLHLFPSAVLVGSPTIWSITKANSQFAGIIIRYNRESHWSLVAGPSHLIAKFEFVDSWGGQKPRSKDQMETYNGYIRTPADAILLIQACYNGFLPRVGKRLSPKEGRSIRNGSVFIWEEHESGLRRWTDGRKWSPSRVSGRFLVYREMKLKESSGSVAEPAPESDITSEDPCKKRDFRSVVGIVDDQSAHRPESQLMKLSFSIASPTGQHWHLINYYHQPNGSASGLREPTTDASLKHICPQRELFPLSLVNDRHNFAIFSKGPNLGGVAPIDKEQTCKMCGSCYRQPFEV
jgi:hypothetical protein